MKPEQLFRRTGTVINTADTQPLVSVITIFLNAEEFLEEAILSVLDQTYPRWELLLVDDGSTDGSTAIAKQFAADHAGRVYYLEHEGHENRGMSASRNLGIANARGRYIAFLDADDRYLPEKLERQVAILQDQPEAAMVYGATLRWYSWTGEEVDHRLDRYSHLGVTPDSLVFPPTLATRIVQLSAHSPATCSVLIRREVFDAIGGFEERFTNMFEDQVFFIKLLLHAPVYVESGSWDLYRQHPNGCCNQMTAAGSFAWGKQRSPSRHAFLHWVDEYRSGRGVTDSEFSKALRKELWSYRHPRVSDCFLSLSRAWSFQRRFYRRVYRRVLRLVPAGSKQIAAGGSSSRNDIRRSAPLPAIAQGRRQVMSSTARDTVAYSDSPPTP